MRSSVLSKRSRRFFGAAREPAKRRRFAHEKIPRVNKKGIHVKWTPISPVLPIKASTREGVGVIELEGAWV
jgi:hypothetical protein